MELIYSYRAKRFVTKAMGQEQVTTTIPISRRWKQIQCLVRERRDFRKQCKRSSQEERAGINLLQADLKRCLGGLWIVENLGLWHKRKRGQQHLSKRILSPLKEKVSSQRKKASHLRYQRVEAHLKNNFNRHVTRTPAGWQSSKARAAPGPNKVPYWLYKNYPKILLCSNSSVDKWKWHGTHKPSLKLGREQVIPNDQDQSVECRKVFFGIDAQRIICFQFPQLDRFHIPNTITVLCQNNRNTQTHSNLWS